MNAYLTAAVNSIIINQKSDRFSETERGPISYFAAQQAAVISFISSS